MDNIVVNSRFSVDSKTDIIHVDASGFWSPEDIEQILDRLASLVGEYHAKRSRALVLVDMSNSGAQMGDTIAKIREKSASIYSAEDRLAIVLESNILKLQIQRVERAANYCICSTIAEAEAWLTSAELAKPVTN